MNKRIRKKKEKQGKYKRRIGNGGIWEITFGYKTVNANLEVLSDGKYIPVNDALWIPKDKGPIEFGFYQQPSSRYMGLAYRPTSVFCETCVRVGMCQYCANRWPIPNKGGQ